MIKLENGDRVEVENIPKIASYKKQENGLYDVTVENYILKDASGRLMNTTLKISNLKLNVNDDCGIISLPKSSLLDEDVLVDYKTEQDCLFEILIPEESEGE